MAKKKNRPHGPGGTARNGRGSSSNSNGHCSGNHEFLPVYIDGKPIGEVVGDTFQKTLQGSIHFLRKPPAIAFDIESLKAAEVLGACKIKIIDSETGIIYRSSISRIWEKGVEIDRGYGKQIFMRLEHWLRPGEEAVHQPSLFGEL